MDVNGTLSLSEAKQVAILKDRAPIGEVVAALDVLYLEIRRLETELQK